MCIPFVLIKMNNRERERSVMVEGRTRNPIIRRRILQTNVQCMYVSCMYAAIIMVVPFASLSPQKA